MNNNSRNDHDEIISSSIKNIEENNSRSPLVKQKPPRRRLLDNGNPKSKGHNNKDIMQPVLHSNHNDFDEEGEEEMMNN